MWIPYSELSPVALRNIVLEFVTRDGTDDSSVEQRIDNVLRQLEMGQVELHFDEASATCQITRAGEA
jgi:uncharacterized protein YheU (UPF0270 family)